MRVLILFVDMVRANLLHVNNTTRVQTPLDGFLKELGGTNYTNCFSSAPDTGRALGVFLSGLSASENGCDNRVRYPRFFLKSNDNLFDAFKKQGYKCDFYLHQHHILPESVMQQNIVLEERLEDFCKNIELQEKHLLFCDIPTYHTVFDNEGFSLASEKKANKTLTQHLEIVFQHFDKDDFDDIYIFSDHGFKFSYEMLLHKITNKPYLLLNEDRTNILMFHRKKGENKLGQITTLCGLEDIHQYIKMNNLHANYTPVENRPYIVVEDHLHFKQRYSNIQIWALVQENEIYIRTFDEAWLLERKTSQLLNKKVNNDYDICIAKESLSFAEVLEILEAKITSNSHNICVDTAQKCVPKSTWYKIANILKDSIMSLPYGR